eukprot:1531452-Alexandrium_andersonii.AAC.1
MWLCSEFGRLATILAMLRFEVSPSGGELPLWSAEWADGLTLLENALGFGSGVGSPGECARPFDFFRNERDRGGSWLGHG